MKRENRKKSILLKASSLVGEQKYEQSLAILTDKIDKLQTTIDQQNETINQQNDTIFELKRTVLDKFDQMMTIMRPKRNSTRSIVNSRLNSHDIIVTEGWNINNSLNHNQSNDSIKRLKHVEGRKLRSSFKKNNNQAK